MTSRLQDGQSEHEGPQKGVGIKKGDEVDSVSSTQQEARMQKWSDGRKMWCKKTDE